MKKKKNTDQAALSRSALRQRFKILVTVILASQICWSLTAFSQDTYRAMTKRAHDFYTAHNYPAALAVYDSAFRAMPDSLRAGDLYFAACASALSGQAEEAIRLLSSAALTYKLTWDANLDHDEAWTLFRKREDWVKIRRLVKQNLEASYTPLQKEMLSIWHDDQFYRGKVDSIQRTEGVQSVKLPALIKKALFMDSVNLIRTKKILDQYGWPSPAEYGNTNQGLFLVIQHADLKTQLQYLPLFREAVKTRYFYPANLAALEDRVAVAQGKKQVYGTQVIFDPKTAVYSLSPIEDEAHVDERRAALGLGPLRDYVKQWRIDYRP